MMLVGGVATHPGRKNSLPLMVRSILPQLNELHVYLNGYRSVPAFLENSKIVPHLGPDLGDRGKFVGLGRGGYYFSLDDDIIYPRDYCKVLRREIDSRDRRVVVGVHGFRFRHPFKNYASCRKVYHYESEISNPLVVHGLGTGTVAFHESTINLSLESFETENAADVWLVLEARRQNVPLLVVSRNKKWLRTIYGTQNDTLWNRTRRSSKKLTSLIKAKVPWGLSVPVTAIIPIASESDVPPAFKSLESLERQHYDPDVVVVSRDGLDFHIPLFKGSRHLVCSAGTKEQLVRAAASAVRTWGILVVTPGFTVPPTFCWEVGELLARAEGCVPHAVARTQAVLGKWHEVSRWEAYSNLETSPVFGYRFPLSPSEPKTTYGIVRGLPEVIPIGMPEGDTLATPSRVGLNDRRSPSSGVTVVIPTYGRPHLLPRAVNSIPLGEVDEILISDDNPGFPKMSLPNCTVIHSGMSDPGGSYARNVGMLSSTFDKIVYLDDDDYMDSRPGAVQRRIKALSSVELTWGDLYLEDWYNDSIFNAIGAGRNVKATPTSAYTKGIPYEVTSHPTTSIMGSMIAHRQNPKKMRWRPPGRKADRRFILFARDHRATARRSPGVVAHYGRKLRYGGMHTDEDLIKGRRDPWAPPGMHVKPQTRSMEVEQSSRKRKVPLRRNPRRHRR